MVSKIGKLADMEIVLPSQWISSLGESENDQQSFAAICEPSVKNSK